MVISLKNSNKYDDGEANYKLPIFNYKDFKIGSYFWSRGVWGNGNGDCRAWYVYIDGGIAGRYVANNDSVRPLIYIR